jgi:hypothetical protein
MPIQSIAVFVVAFVLGGLALLAFERFQPSSSAGAAAVASGCDTAATLNWLSDKGGTYRAEAYANGARCEQSVVTITVRGPDGKLMLSDARAAADVMVFGGVTTKPAMTAALSAWVRQDHQFKTSANLPPWPQGAEAPQAGEFPFYPEADVDRDTYEKIRAVKAPVFCYVQGMESMACYALSRDETCLAGYNGAQVCAVPEMRKIGLQLFPG